MYDRQIRHVWHAAGGAGAEGAGDDAIEARFDLFEGDRQSRRRAQSLLPARGPGVCSNACCTAKRIRTGSRGKILKPIFSGMP